MWTNNVVLYYVTLQTIHFKNLYLGSLTGQTEVNFRATIVQLQLNLNGQSCNLGVPAVKLLSWKPLYPSQWSD